MSNNRFRPTRLALGCFLLLISTTSCLKNSTIARNVAVGPNGSFEQTRSDRPVNWHVYHKALKRNKAQLSFDTEEAQDGEQSLKFSVISCSDRGGWQSPGIFQDFDVVPRTTYRVSFWLKNDQCKFNVNITGVAPKTPMQGNRMLTQEGVGNEWRKYDINYTTRANESALRFELNITGPGSLWIDDVSVRQVDGT